MIPMKKQSRKTLFAIATACMCAAAPAIAQEFDLQEIFNITLETGSFLELDLEKSPVTMTIIDDEMIENSAVRNLSEALEVYVPGFQAISNKWNGTVWGMRGVTSDRNNKVIVLINGQKQNLQNFHGFATEYDLGLMGDIERIEVLRGPAGLVYGSGAIAGVVNIVTSSPEENSNYASVKFDVNGANSVHGITVEGGLNHTFDNDHSLIVQGGYRKSEGLGENVGRGFGSMEDGGITPDSGTVTAGSPGMTPGNWLFSADYVANNFRLYGRATRQYSDVSSYFAETQADKWRGDRRMHIRDNMMVAAEYGWDIGDDRLSIDGSIISASNGVINKEVVGSTGGVDGIILPENYFASTGETRYETTLKYLLKRVDNLQVAVGGQFGYHDIGENIQGENTWGVAKIEYNNIAGFGEAFFEINDVIALGAGVRYDKHTRTDGVVSPKAALVVTPNENHSIKFIVQSSSNNADALTYEPAPTARKGEWTYERGAEYGENDSIYVTAVDADDVATEYSDNRDDALTTATGERRTVLGNTQAPVAYVEPEKSMSFELATSHTFGSFNMSPSFSYNKMSELHMWNGALKQTVNVGEYDAFVVELELSNEWDKFSIGGNAALMMPFNFDTTAISFSRSGFDPVYDTELGAWTPNPIADSAIVSTDALVKEQLSYDNKYFNSLHTVTAKVFADWEPSDFVTFHTDARLFFGLWGRSPLEKENRADANAATSFLGMSRKTVIAKWDMSVHFHLPKDFDVSILAYNLLGEDDNKHAARWSQMSDPVQDGYYTVDQRSFGLKLSKEF